MLKTSKKPIKSRSLEISLSTEVNYIHHRIVYTVQRTSHTNRNSVFTINGLNKCKCTSIRAAEKRISQTRKLLESFVNNPAFVPQNDEFLINAKVHQIGYALIIFNNKPMIVSLLPDKSQKTEEVTLLGKHTIWKDNDYIWKKFLDQVKVASPNTQVVTPHVPQRMPTRKFTSASDDTLFDVFEIFNRKQIQYIKDFDMDDIGRYRISTVPNITRKEAGTYQKILASVLKGSCEAITNNDEERKMVYSRLVYLVPPMLLRKPKGSVTKRMEAFINGDLEYCTKGMLHTRDNFITLQRSSSSKMQAAASKVFNGQYAKAISILTNEDVSAPPREIREALIAKHPPRSVDDNIMIMKLPSSIPTSDVSEEEVYSTAMNPTKRGVAPGPNGDRAEFLQSALFNPYESSGASTVIKYLTKHINLERQGKLSEEWYNFTSSSILHNMQPI
jgi:hypothetical protein